MGRKITRLATWLTVLTLVLSGLQGLALGHEPGQQYPGSRGSGQGNEETGVEVKLPDVELLNQDGRSVRFKSDVVAGRIVAINFLYTTCTTICPVTSAIFAQVQQALGDRLGQEVWLLSISVDPTRDTPARLKAYAHKVGAQPGWLWLTGQKHRVDQVLQGLGTYTPDFVDHPSVVLIGDGQRGGWTRLYGLPSPDDIRTRLEALVAARHASPLSLKIQE